MGKSLQTEKNGGGRTELWGSAGGRDCLEHQEPAKSRAGAGTEAAPKPGACAGWKPGKVNASRREEST